ncbi:MAG: insulinase family protein [Elusimicrobia bacterium]|nr:insulinase family protein [Candidatus Obscuribacterium magneticum]
MLVVLFVAPLHADPINDFPSRVKRITCKNGLRVLMVERPASPTVSFATFIRTGALDDEPGKSGIAHLFEHMLFKGTKTIGTKDYPKEVPLMQALDETELALQKEKDKGALADSLLVTSLEEKIAKLEKEQEALIDSEGYWKIYERAGAQDFNAGTGYDYTTYTVSLPKNAVTLWMTMESDRIQHPILREFYKERDVVLEERRLRIDTSPDGRLQERFLAAAFMVHPYRRPIIGWENEISRVTRMDAERFFKKHYDVSRLVFAVVGGFDAAEMESLIRKHFEGIPSSNNFTPSFPNVTTQSSPNVTTPSSPNVTAPSSPNVSVGDPFSKMDPSPPAESAIPEELRVRRAGQRHAGMTGQLSAAPVVPEPAQAGERRITVRYDAEPSLIIGYHRPDMLHPDASALDVTSSLLTDGRTSRFFKEVVQKKRVAVSAWASASFPGEREPNLFVVGGEPRSPHAVEDVEKSLYSAILALSEKGPTENELQKVKNNLEANFIRGLSSNLGLASQLAYYEALAGDWKILLNLVDGIRAVKKEDVQRVIKTYLTADNRTVAILKKEGK